ncbi:uncharacterized protein BT62DRAFT_1003442 [Guyanagaster necrorhizus]|uniref:Uncharacterized protein n=1 Tax=Guyanagaster necrorhizus TaxID=856835 RepID=A0A9P7VZN6_9AGAR|nr:uncharacterized protein BT62DRAFT_1003442 [Guyanagaster necrorhizus MCA 3950]KAG7448736.1 hypothetical protein BT62DRAFT_1003442 [Guyanagaster necrorhizus MCA 3950]
MRLVPNGYIRGMLSFLCLYIFFSEFRTRGRLSSLSAESKFAPRFVERFATPCRTAGLPSCFGLLTTILKVYKLDSSRSPFSMKHELLLFTRLYPPAQVLLGTDALLIEFKLQFSPSSRLLALFVLSFLTALTVCVT